MMHIRGNALGSQWHRCLAYPDAWQMGVRRSTAVRSVVSFGNTDLFRSFVGRGLKHAQTGIAVAMAQLAKLQVEVTSDYFTPALGLQAALHRSLGEHLSRSAGPLGTPNVEEMLAGHTN